MTRDMPRASAIFSTPQTIEAAGQIWESLLDDNYASHIHATYAGYRVWVSHFVTAQKLPLLHLQIDGQSQALLPIESETLPLFKLGLRRLRSPGNYYWNSGYPVIKTGSPLDIQIFLNALGENYRWDILDLGPMLEAAPLTADLSLQAGICNMFPKIVSRTTDECIEINGEWAGYYATRSGKLRSTVGQGERRLKAKGLVTLQECRGGSQLSSCLEEFFEVESRGWKGREGTAIKCSPTTQSFYTDLALTASALGWLRLYLLRIDGICIAGEYCLTLNGTTTVLKLGYDESWSRFSPGHVLKKMLLQHLFETEQQMVYSQGSGGGAHMSYKQNWSTCKREYIVLRLFNPRRHRAQLARKLSNFRRLLREWRVPRSPDSAVATHSL